MRISDWSSDVCSSDLDEVHALALRLDVVDDGHGVPEALAEQVFLPLVSGRAEGSGLGLALAQQVAREHRGPLAYRSRPGHTVLTRLRPVVHADDEEGGDARNRTLSATPRPPHGAGRTAASARGRVRG